METLLSDEIVEELGPLDARVPLIAVATKLAYKILLDYYASLGFLKMYFNKG
jgi:hypothetical protein